MTTFESTTRQNSWLLAWRLWKYNGKHSIGRWLVPVYLGLALYANRNPTIRETITWVHISAGIGVASVMIAPVAAGIATWLAVNNRRHGPEELLSVIPMHRSWHDLALVGGLVAWVCSAYFTHGFGQGAVAIRQATWGSLDLAPVWVGLLTITVAVSSGYVLGLLMPSLLTPPLIAITAFIALVAPYGYKVSSNAPDGQLSPQYLSPYSFLVLQEQAVYLRPWNTVFLPLSGWLTGLTLFALAGIILCSRRTRAGVVLVLIAISLCGTSAYSLIHLPGQLINIPDSFVPYQPACTQRAVEICVHPA